MGTSKASVTSIGILLSPYSLGLSIGSFPYASFEEPGVH